MRIQLGIGLFLAAGLLASACAPAAQPTPPAATSAAAPKPAAQQQQQPSSAGQINATAAAAAPATPAAAQVAAPAVAAPAGAQLVGATWLANPQDMKAKAQSGGTINVRMANDPPHFDPGLTTSYLMASAITPVYNTLLRCKPGPLMEPYDPWSCQLEGDLVKEWSFAPDNMQLTLKLQQGVKFQNLPPVNGREFVASDVKYNLERYAKQADLKDLFDDLQSVEVVDTYTAKLIFKSPAPYFTSSPLAENRIMMLAKEIEDQKGDFKETAIGTGPFILKTYDKGARLVYEKNPTYFKPGLPYLDGFTRPIIKDAAAYEAAFLAGQVDDWGVSADKLETLKQREPSAAILRRSSYRGYSTYHLAMRLDQAPFNDERVRRAMALAMDQDAIIRTVYRGNGSIRTNLPWLAAFETEPGRDAYGPLASPNVAEAKKLLADAGFPNGFDAKLEWTQYGANDPDLLQLVQAELATAGIKITLDKQEYVNFIGKWYSGKFDQLALGFIATFPQDWTTMTYLTRHSGKGQNVWNINDPDMDRLTEELKANAGSIDKQRPTFRKLWDLEVSKEYFIPLPDPPADSAWKAYVHNWEISDRTQMPDWGGRQFEIIWTDKK